MYVKTIHLFDLFTPTCNTIYSGLVLMMNGSRCFFNYGGCWRVVLFDRSGAVRYLLRHDDDSSGRVLQDGKPGPPVASR